MEVEWHYFDTYGVQQGPVEKTELKVLFKQSVLNGDSFVWREGLADWVGIATLPELADVHSPAPPPQPDKRRMSVPPRPPAPVAPTESKDESGAAFKQYLNQKGFPPETHDLVLDRLSPDARRELLAIAPGLDKPIKYANAMIEGQLSVVKQVRHCALLPGVIKFFKDAKRDAKEAGSIKLDPATVISTNVSEKKAKASSAMHPWPFSVEGKDGKKKRVLTVLYAPTQEVRDLWVKLLKTARYGVLPEDKSISTDHVLCEMTYDMMMGIRTTVGRQQGIPANAISSDKDFAEVSSISFPAKGSKGTPPHKMRDFGFKDYCPAIFQRIRARFGIDPASYLLDVCGNFNFLEFVSNSKSGEFFFHSHNRRYMIKTVSHAECRCLFDNMRHYYRHLMSNPSSCVNKFFGLHKVKPAGRPFYFLIMGSIFPSTLKIHRLFDLKGSTRNRSVKPAQRGEDGTCYKDNDFVEQQMKLVLGPEMAGKLKNQIKKDVQILEDMRIIDYSVLLGIHYKHGFDPETLKATDTTNDLPPVNPELSDAASTETPLISKSPELEAWRKQLASFVAGDGAALLAEIVELPDSELEALTAEDFVQKANKNPLAIFMYQSVPIRNTRQGSTKSVSFRPVDTDFSASFPLGALPRKQQVPELSKSIFACDQGGLAGHDQDGNEVLFFVGLIDTLIEYNLKKKMEHSYKASVKRLDPASFSVVEPAMYSQRMLAFLEDKIV